MKEVPEEAKPMLCDKCGFGYMVDDSYHDIKVYKCWVCGNRIYLDHLRRRGSLVCSRCGADMDRQNELGYCKDCLKLLNIDPERMRSTPKANSLRARRDLRQKKSRPDLSPQHRSKRIVAPFLLKENRS